MNRFLKNFNGKNDALYCNWGKQLKIWISPLKNNKKSNILENIVIF